MRMRPVVPPRACVRWACARGSARRSSSTVAYGGVAVVGSQQPEPMPPDTEARVGDFADLVATAIANAEARAALTASRAPRVAAGDDARRRIERDLHDGAQQRLVSLGLQLRTAEALVPPEQPALRDHISGIATRLAPVSWGGVGGAPRAPLRARGGRRPPRGPPPRRSAVPVELDLRVDQRL